LDISLRDSDSEFKYVIPEVSYEKQSLNTF